MVTHARPSALGGIMYVFILFEKGDHFLVYDIASKRGAYIEHFFKRWQLLFEMRFGLHYTEHLTNLTSKFGAD